MRKCYSSEDLKEARAQVVWMSRGIQQEAASVKVLGWKLAWYV